MRRRSFSLVEVLVALTLCGAGLAVVASAAAAGIRGEGYAGGLTRATDHAELILTRLESGELELDAAEGDFEEEGVPELSWKVEVDTTELENLSLVSVTIVYPLHGQERELSVKRWVYTDPLAGRQ